MFPGSVLPIIIPISCFRPYCKVSNIVDLKFDLKIKFGSSE